MMTSFLDPARPLPPAFWITVKASVVLVVAALVQALMYRRASAAMRHLVWTVAIVGVLLVPLLSLALPAWPVVIRTVAAKAAGPLSPNDGVRRAAGPARSGSALRAKRRARRPGRRRPGPFAARVGAAVSWPAVAAGVYAAGVLVMLDLTWRSNGGASGGSRARRPT